MENGYQIIELVTLQKLVGNPKHLEFASIILSWLVECVKVQLGEKLSNAEVEVISVVYHGSYPSIGIRYLAENMPDVGPLVETEMNRIIKAKTVLDLIESL